jgi:hypothetical protein
MSVKPGGTYSREHTIIIIALHIHIHIILLLLFFFRCLKSAE